MAQLNLKFSEECITCFQDLKMKSKYSFIIYKLVNNYKEIAIDTKMETTGEDSQQVFEKLRALIPANESRWAVFTMNYDTKDKEGRSTGKRSKTVFISSTPNSAPVKDRLLYASSRQSFKRALGGLAVDVQTSPDSICYEELLQKCMQFTTA